MPLRVSLAIVGGVLHIAADREICGGSIVLTADSDSKTLHGIQVDHSPRCEVTLHAVENKIVGQVVSRAGFTTSVYSLEVGIEDDPPK